MQENIFLHCKFNGRVYSNIKIKHLHKYKFTDGLFGGKKIFKEIVTYCCKLLNFLNIFCYLQNTNGDSIIKLYENVDTNITFKPKT